VLRAKLRQTYDAIRIFFIVSAFFMSVGVLGFIAWWAVINRVYFVPFSLGGWRVSLPIALIGSMILLAKIISVTKHRKNDPLRFSSGVKELFQISADRFRSRDLSSLNGPQIEIVSLNHFPNKFTLKAKVRFRDFPELAEIARTRVFIANGVLVENVWNIETECVPNSIIVFADPLALSEKALNMCAVGLGWKSPQII
jgi:hypothetical protein